MHLATLNSSGDDLSQNSHGSPPTHPPPTPRQPHPHTSTIPPSPPHHPARHQESLGLDRLAGSQRTRGLPDQKLLACALGDPWAGPPSSIARKRNGWPHNDSTVRPRGVEAGRSRPADEPERWSALVCCSCKGFACARHCHPKSYHGNGCQWEPMPAPFLRGSSIPHGHLPLATGLPLPRSLTPTCCRR